MKRRSQSTSSQPLLKISSSTDILRSAIASKLQSHFDRFVSDLQNISKEKDPDLTVFFDTQHVSDFINYRHNINHSLSVNDNVFENDSTLILQDFISSAKSRISGLLNKEQNFQEAKGSLLKSTHESYSQGPEKTLVTDPLQIQISLKIQSLLCKAIDSKKLITNGNRKNTSSGNVNESELQDLSHMVQDFMNLAKQKLSVSLSKGHGKHQSNDIKSSYQSQLCTVPQVSPCCPKRRHINKQLSVPCRPGTNAELLNQSAIQSKFNKLGKENLHFLSGLKRRPLIHSSKMYSPHLSDSDSFDSSTLYIPEMNLSCNSNGNGKGGMLFLEDSERTPEFLDLEINTDINQPESDSDEEVIILGEKRPTYEEITLEEDDDDEVEKVDKGEKLEDKKIKELLFKCPNCEKVYRAESLLKFHLRMHNVEFPPLASASKGSLKRQRPNRDDESSMRKSTKIFKKLYMKREGNKDV